ncbi:hypothetical protein TNCV_513181 [Trichonephila clavipes]|nr:hypothetical protein TNCV_513181 [Trichonephila clavipes]
MISTLKVTLTHMKQRKAVSLEHLLHYHEDGNDFLFWIVMVGPPSHSQSEGHVNEEEKSVITSSMLFRMESLEFWWAF